MGVITTKQQEAEMIQRALEGDNSQFEMLFNLHKNALKEFLVKLSGNEFDANDLLQESFIKAFLNLDKYRTEFGFLQWLYTIAKNTFIDRKRREAVKGSLLTFDSLYVADIAVDNPEDMLVNMERNKRLLAFINSLDVNSSEILKLRYFDGLSYEEISKEIDVPIGTVKNRLFRAKERLAALLVANE